MNKKINPIPLAIFVGLILYILDSVIYYLLKSGDHTFLQSLVAGGSIQEIYSRLLMITGVIIFGIIVYGKINEIMVGNKSWNKQPKIDTQGSIDYSFLSSLSHQVRTPLNAIIGFSELLKKPNLTPGSKKIYLSHINSSSKYLLLLFNSVSEISKIGSDELTINRVGTNINQIIEELYKVFLVRKSEMEKSNIPLIIEKINPYSSFFILTDPEKLKFVLNNLLENAFVQTEAGVVKMGYTLKGDDFVEFYVNNPGQGISQERLEIIFERYNKLTDNKNFPFDGSEFRLAISKSLVKIMGGDIWADSKMGEGVTIYFTIPYLQTDKLKKVPSVKKVIPPKVNNWENRQILIVEDIKSNYVYLEELLSPTHISIVWAKNGVEAINVVKSNPKIELVLMDILMPEMDGFEAAREIKKIREELPIIAQTAFSIEDGTKEEDKKNFNAYLIKPIWAPQLIASLENYLL